MAKSKSLVKDYMTKNVVTVSPQTTTEEVIKLMKNINITEIFKNSFFFFEFFDTLFAM